MIPKKTVLIIDDEAHLRVAFQLALESEGYAVALAEHGKAGLAILRTMDPPCCAVVTDLKMPEMDGYEFLQEKNKSPAIAAIPVIVVSATAVEKSLQGVAEIIKKPFDLSALLAAIEKHHLK